MKKRFLSVVLACSLTAVSLAGCGGGGSKETQPKLEKRKQRCQKQSQRHLEIFLR